MSQEDDEILSDFIVESKEGLDSIEDDFLLLEKTKDDVDIDLVNKVFRAIHSIKGASGFLGLTKIGKLAHVMENLISKIRDGEIRPESAYVDALLEGVDLLSAMLDDVSHPDSIDTTTVLEKLESFLIPGAQTSLAVPEQLVEPVEVKQDDSAPEMDDLQKQVLAELMADVAGVELPAEVEPPQPVAVAKKDSTKKTSPSKKTSETIRINVELLDQLMQMAGELVLVRNQQLLSVDKNDPKSRSLSQKLDTVTTDLQEGIMKTRMQPIGNIFGKFPRVIRDMGKKLGKKLEISTTGDEVDLDKTILESLADPLTHLIRNSCDHGVELPADRVKAGKTEESTIFLHAYHEGGQVNIKIVDDGKGINIDAVKQKVIEKGLRTEEEIDQMSQKDLANLITLPGLSTAKTVTDVSGRGVGMDVVCTSIEKLGGTLEIETEEGKGTTITLKLPLTLAIISSLLVRVGQERFAIPQVSLDELVSLYDSDIYDKFEVADNQAVYRLRDCLLPVVGLRDIFSQNEVFSQEDKGRFVNQSQQKEGEPTDGKNLVFAVLKMGDKRFGLIVDEVLGTEEIVVKPMHPALKHLNCYSGTTVLGDGQVALILDIEGISRFSSISYHESRNHDSADELVVNKTQSVLLFKSGEQEQLAIPLDQIKRIQPISTDQFEKAGEHLFIQIDETPTRVVKLHEYVSLSKCEETEQMFLILPKGDHPFGLLVSSLVNIEEVTKDLNQESLVSEGLLGSALVHECMTIFVDIDKVGEMALGASV